MGRGAEYPGTTSPVGTVTTGCAAGFGLVMAVLHTARRRSSARSLYCVSETRRIYLSGGLLVVFGPLVQSTLR